MPIQILMPALSPTMSEGNLAKWLKKEGDEIKSGDILAEIETDKATMELEAVEEGKLAKILIPDGSQGVKVNEPIALLLEEGEDASALDDMPKAAPAPAPAAAPAPAQAAPVQPQPQPAAAKAPVPAAAHDGRVFASPLARRIARDAEIDLAQVTGSGPHGRIVKADVEQARAGGVAKAPPRPAAPPAAPAGITPAYVEIPHTNMRKTIARRLTEAKQTVPHFYLTIDCDIDPLLAIRKQLNDRAEDYKLSVNDFVVKAVAVALKKVPAANASWTDTAIRQFTDIDISVAVATPGGLITPVLRAADRKGLGELSNEMKALAAKARDGKLMPEEYTGGGFSISNLGMYGIKHFEAIINPPQGAILAIGAGEQRPVVKDGQLAVGTVMSCTLSVDHRVIDGAVGAEFLAAFKKVIEDPLRMLL